MKEWLRTHLMKEWISYSTNPFKSCSMAGESTPSQKRALFSDTRFCTRSHGNLCSTVD